MSKLIWFILSLVLIVAPLSYAQGKWIGLTFGIIVGALNSLGFRRNFVQGIAAGLVAGLTTNVTFSYAESTLLSFSAAFAVGFTATVAQETEIDRSRLFATCIVGLVMGLTIGFVPVYTKGLAGGISYLLVITVISGIVVPIGALFGYWLRPKLLLFSDVWLYLREMGAYLVSFALGYIALALLFACWFWSLWKIFPSQSFGGLSSDPSFGEFVYFSLITIATLGYGDITPKSELARGLVGAEVILGIGWITIVFAAVVSHLQPRFADIAKKRSEEMDETFIEETATNYSPIYTIMISETEDDGKGVYATIRDDYAKDATGKPIHGKEFGFRMWGAGLKSDTYQKASCKTAKEAEGAAKEMYRKLKT